MFIDSILSPEHCMLMPESFNNTSDPLEEQLEDDTPELETLIYNFFSIKLFDDEGSPHYVSSS